MSSDELFKKAMAEVKEAGKKMLEASYKETAEHRRDHGMDSNGHPIKGVTVNAETGEMEAKKRGRKPKPKVEKIVKPKKEKVAVKKAKSDKKGKVASVPALVFNDETLEVKFQMFENAMTAIFGDRYINGTLLTDKNILFKFTQESSGSGNFAVGILRGEEMVKFYEYKATKRLYMAKIVHHLLS